MTLSPKSHAETMDDESIRHALQEADLAPMAAALACLTGDLSVLRDEFRPNALALGLPHGGISEPAQAELRERAFDVLQALRDGKIRADSAPSPDDVRRIIAFLLGDGSADYEPLILEELALDDVDLRAPNWTKDQLAPDRDFQVLVVGAGMSGLLAACRLKQAGVQFTIVDKNQDVGGTWLQNTYPGCRVDNPNHVYSYSFAQRDDWPLHFSAQPVLLGYFREFADRFGLRPHTRFQTEVCDASFDEEERMWTVRLRTPDGEETVRAHAIISAVGQLNRPLIPDIDGRESFAGPIFHSGEWDHSVDLHGKRVAVIGNGASAAQFVPVVAEQAAECRVYQRTPNWFFPTPNYHDALPDGLLRTFRNLPYYRAWYRVWLFWRTADGMLPAFTVDPQWDGKGRSVSPANEMIRGMLAQWIEQQFADMPELAQSMVPEYPPAAKRIILDNGSWPAALHRDNVTVCTTPIERITPSGVRTTDGQEFEADVVIFGTGFQASRFLTPMRMAGRGGADIHAQWDGDARAYLGITVPNFPNLFILYGPNTNIVVNGSTVYFAECEVHYVMQAIRFLLEGGHDAMDCRQDVHDAYNRRIDEGNELMAWGAVRVNSWYRNAKGRIAQNWPGTMLEYWKQTREVDPADYELL